MFLAAYGDVFMFLAAGIVFVLGSFVASWCLRPQKPSPEKLTTYECGETPIGSSFIQYNVRYYLIALVFVVFDVEVLFLFPWAVAMKACGLAGFIEVLVFVLILGAGLVYCWRRKVLEWL